MLTMKKQTLFSSSFVLRCVQVSALVSLGFLGSCTKEEAAAPQAEKPPPSLVEQYKTHSQESAANPGVAGSPGDLAEEKKKEESH
jgi:hypothetical protein